MFACVNARLWESITEQNPGPAWMMQITAAAQAWADYWDVRTRETEFSR